MDSKGKILVTGSSGQLGRRLIPVLLEYGYDVVPHYRNREKADKYCPDGLKPVIGSIESPDWITEAVKGCDHVIHGAAIVSVRPLKDDSMMKLVNVEGTRAVVEACLKAGVKRLLQVSSIAAVGASKDSTPLDETAEFNLGKLGLPYMNTKYESEQIALAAVKRGLDVVVVNPSIMISPPDRPVTEKDLKKIPKRIPVYFDFGLNLVETADVINGMLLALEKGRSGERYLLTGENLGPERIFELLNKYFDVKKPWLKLPYPIIWLLGGLAEIIYLTKNKKPRLNRKTAKLFNMKLFYSSAKAERELGYKYKPVEQTINDILKKTDLSKVQR